MADGTGEYTAFMLDGQPAAGMIAIQKEWGEFPPYWSIYFGVENLDAARGASAKALGAREITPELTVPERRAAHLPGGPTGRAPDDH